MAAVYRRAAARHVYLAENARAGGPAQVFRRSIGGHRPHAFPKARRAGRPRAFAGRRLPLDWTSCARMIAAIRPGKRASISEQRAAFCISTPRRSLRIRPASRRILKCCDKVDFGMSFSLIFRNLEQFCEQTEAMICAKIATRTGSDKACRIPSTVTSLIDGWNSGLIRHDYIAS